MWLWFVAHWLWFAAPLVAGLIYGLTGQRDPRRDAELQRWQNQMRREVKPAGYRSAKEVKTAKLGPGPLRVTSMPGPLTRILDSTGGGARLDTFTLVPKLAYLVAVGADAFQASDHTTVVARLDEVGPSFTVRPLPIVEGERIANTGVAFKKDPEFMALFLVERGLEAGPSAAVTEEGDKAIRKWLSPPLREALLDLPDAWLRVDGKTRVMAFTLYGPADADRIQELLAAADIVFAEYGADGGPSLLGDEEEEALPQAPPSKKAAAASKSPASRG
jgi:hypothetical protein